VGLGTHNLVAVTAFNLEIVFVLSLGRTKAMEGFDKLNSRTKPPLIFGNFCKEATFHSKDN
jgi:hypothetical protein